MPIRRFISDRPRTSLIRSPRSAPRTTGRPGNRHHDDFRTQLRYHRRARPFWQFDDTNDTRISVLDHAPGVSGSGHWAALALFLRLAVRFQWCTLSAVQPASGHVWRDLVPSRRQLRRIGQLDCSITFGLRFPRGDEAKRYNVLQRLTYLAIIFVRSAAASPHRLDDVAGSGRGISVSDRYFRRPANRPDHPFHLRISRSSASSSCTSPWCWCRASGTTCAR